MSDLDDLQITYRALGSSRTSDLDGWHPRQDIPQTEALARQKKLAADPEVKLMGDILDSGALPGRVGKSNRARARELYDHFRRRARTLNYWSDNQFVDFFGKIGAKRKRSNGTVWVFPPLEEARASFRAGRLWWSPFDPMMTEWEPEFEETEGADD